MNIYETIELIRSQLEAGLNNDADLLFGYKVVTDPYSSLSKLVPLILIEADRTEFVNAEYGTPVAQDHHLSFTIFESAQKADFDSYKKNVNEAVKKLIDKLISINDYRVSKLIPTELSHAEAVIDSLKVTGIVLGVRVRTNWED